MFIVHVRYALSLRRSSLIQLPVLAIHTDFPVQVASAVSVYDSSVSGRQCDFAVYASDGFVYGVRHVVFAFVWRWCVYTQYRNYVAKSTHAPKIF